MKLRIARPSLVVDISRLAASRHRDPRRRAPHRAAHDVGRDRRRSQLPRPALAAIAECARGIGDLQVRNRGTIGGSVAHADPASDMPAVLLALGARARRSARRRASGRSRSPTSSLGPFTTALGAQELITDVVVPRAGRRLRLGVRIGRAPGIRIRARRRRRARRAGRRGASRVTGIAGTPLLVPRDRSRGCARRRRDLRRPLRTRGVPARTSPSSCARARLESRASARGGGCGVTEIIGIARPRIDAPDKVTGATRYAADGLASTDCSTPVSFSPPKHTRASRGIDREAALAIPGVVAVLTAADLPIATTGTDRTAEPLAREEVVFAGQPVALVVAESEAAAEDGAELVLVEYEPLPAVVDVEAAMEPGSPLARTRRGGRGRAAISSRSTPASTTARQDDQQERALARTSSTASHAERRRRRRRARGQRRRRLGDVHARRGCTRRTSSPRSAPRGSSRPGRSSSRRARRARSSRAASSRGRSTSRWSGFA